MSDPFKTDYAGEPTTAAQVGKAAAEPQVDPALPLAGSTEPLRSTNQPPDFGFQPSIYGTGKPRRIIIRGKISVG